jgi:hypothetical protein
MTNTAYEQNLIEQMEIIKKKEQVEEEGRSIRLQMDIKAAEDLRIKRELERKRLEEQMERERIQREQKEREIREQLERERIEREERERRLLLEKLERERIERERLLREQMERERQERIIKEKIERERQEKELVDQLAFFEMKIEREKQEKRSKNPSSSPSSSFHQNIVQVDQRSPPQPVSHASNGVHHSIQHPPKPINSSELLIPVPEATLDPLTSSLIHKGFDRDVVDFVVTHCNRDPNRVRDSTFVFLFSS